MAEPKGMRDKHFPLWALDNPFRRLAGDPQKAFPYVRQGQVVADLGCGPGFYTLPLAKRVGPGATVYAVDSDPRAIQAIEKKAARLGLHNIRTHAGSAAQLGFIPDSSVDFILANGLLCSMARRDQAACIREMLRILKQGGKAYLVAGRGAWSNLADEEWETILGEFSVEDRNHATGMADNWALVTKKM